MTTRQPSVYLSGPMTGVLNGNMPLFDEVAEFFGSLDYHVRNPWDIQHNIEVEWTDGDALATPTAEQRATFLRGDFKELLEADLIALLPGWDESVGACAELTVAILAGLEVVLVRPAAPAPGGPAFVIIRPQPWLIPGLVERARRPMMRQPVELGLERTNAWKKAEADRLEVFV